MNDREKDDKQKGRILTRRELVSILGGVGAGMLVSDVRAQCVGRPEQTEGPYYLDVKLNRSDIRSDPSDGSVAEGIPLLLEFRVSRITSQGCSPLAGAEVDVWHCDARGTYSGVRDPRFNTTGKRFLRGYQVADSAGTARFKTIYPGWYPGRTVHIHFKIRANSSSGKQSEFTSQLYFDDATTDQVCTHEPYVRNGRRMMRNSDDFIFRDGGKQLLLSLAKTAEGYSAVFDISLVS